jgi:hypothetical protein
MSIRIEIELTSSAPDGSWTWRAAGAREPRGVLDGSILPAGSSVGDQLRVESEKDIDGIRVLSVVPPKEKAERSGLLELLPSDVPFEPVVQHRAPGSRGDGPRRPRRDRPEGERRDRRDRPPRDDRGGGGERRGPGGPGAGDRERRGPRPEGGDDRRRQRPHFTPPPELPQRPKPKRLRPGKQHRTDVLASTPEEQRPIAELALQGMAAVRQRLREDNVRMKAEGKPEMPEAAVMKMAEEMLPRLRVADWLDRAEAAQRQLEHLDLRDLRSVVAASDDPLVARDETTRELASSLKAALVTKQDEELALWLSDVEAALDVGRVVRTLRLSSQPPKAGVPFPGSLATRLAEATTASLQPIDGPDRWAAVLEAAAFSPIRALVTPAAPAEAKSDELLATVKRLGPLLPQVAALFGIEVPPNAPSPKPLRPTTRRDAPKKQAARPEREPRPRREPAAEKPADEAAPATAEAPIEPVAEPTDLPVAEPADLPAAEPAELPGEEPTPAAEVAGEVFDAPPAAEPAPEPAAEADAQIADVPAAEPVAETPDAPAAEPVAETPDAPVDEPTPADEPAADA